MAAKMLAIPILLASAVLGRSRGDWSHDEA